MVKCFTVKKSGQIVCPKSKGMRGKFNASRISSTKSRKKITVKKKVGRPKGKKDRSRRKTRSDAGMKTYKKLPQARAMVNRIKMMPKLSRTKKQKKEKRTLTGKKIGRPKGSKDKKKRKPKRKKSYKV
jgi:hypothetical protein